MTEEIKKKILLVDDEPDLLMILKVRIESEGFDVTTATDGQEALDMALKGGFDVVVTDVLMPNMDGFAFYKELKKSPLTQDTPILVLTARGQMEDAFKVVGVDEFIAKPYDEKELIAKIKRLADRDFIAIQSQSQHRILIIGDNEEAVENMAVQLKKTGCGVDLVLSGPQAISKAVMYLPTMIIIETDVYGISSNEIIHVLRQMQQFEKIPILVYSYYELSKLGNEDVRQRALAVDASQELCMEAGATEYIGRFNEQSFIKTVQQYLK